MALYEPGIFSTDLRNAMILVLSVFSRLFYVHAFITRELVI